MEFMNLGGTTGVRHVVLPQIPYGNIRISIQSIAFPIPRIAVLACESELNRGLLLNQVKGSV